MLVPPRDLALPGDFTAASLARAAWIHELDGATRAELADLMRRIDDGERDATIEQAVHAAMAVATAKTIDALDRGHGFILLRGVPVEGRSRDTLATLYTMMGRALGRPKIQNLEGELLTDIRDTGADPNDPDVRLYRTRAEQDFHTDGADVVGLLCLQPAKAGGASRLVSSVRVYRAVADARPDLAPLLFEPWWFHLPGGAVKGLPPAIPRPIAQFDGRKLETFFIGWYIRNAQTLATVPELDDARRALLALYEATANDPSLYIDMEFRAGDIQWLRNAFVLHKRTAYEDHAQPERKRHLLRLWLDLERLADGMPRFPDQPAR